MNQHDPIDYQAALDAFRKEEHTPDNPVRNTGVPVSPPMIDGCVDYQAAAKAWDKGQAGKHVIYTEEHEDESRL